VSTAGKKFPAEPLTPREVAALIDACSRKAPTGIRNRAMLVLLYWSGLRISELLALRVSDVDLDRHSIRLLDTKSGRAQSRGFHPSAADALCRWLDTRKKMGFPRGSTLFCTLQGGQVSDRYVRDMMKRAARKAGLEKRVHPHAMRHSFAVELEAAGVPVTAISGLLGHSSIAITARYLNHLTNRQAIRHLENVKLPPLELGQP
jgi:integrase/recombinase XerD